MFLEGSVQSRRDLVALAGGSEVLRRPRQVERGQLHRARGAAAGATEDAGQSGKEDEKTKSHERLQGNKRAQSRSAIPCHKALPASKLSGVKSIAIIPARLASTRLPRKVLRKINGRPMLEHVYEAARACPGWTRSSSLPTPTRLSICAGRTVGRFHDFASHRSGTDRVHEVCAIGPGRCVRECPGRRTTGSQRASRHAACADGERRCAGRER